MPTKTTLLSLGAFSALLLSLPAGAAPPDRILRPIDNRSVTRVNATVHRLANAQYDQGAVDPGFPMDYMMLLVKPSAAQQSELDKLLADQRNPASPQFHKWLTPEEFGDRFGLNASDHSKLVAWLQREGFTIRESARARNWIAFSGTAGQVQRSLHTAIHRYRVKGELHFANSAEPSVPAAFAEIVGGFVGLHDFNPKPALTTVSPDFNSGTTHFLVPEDFATIYNVAPLSAAGIDGTGVNIGIIGFSQLVVSDIQMFRSRYNLPAKDPKTQVVGTNPGVTGSLTEADLDIEWASAVAPNATIYYYYSTSSSGAIIGAINANAVHIISMSFGGSEYDNLVLSTQPIFQQANAQGITMLASTGDSGAASFPDSGSNATKGPVVQWPATFPETTAVGGTQFNEGTGTYWATSNSPNFGSALSYIPEIAWVGGGGGASSVFPKPAWQTGPGVPADGARDIPDVSLSASLHDSYYIASQGSFFGVGGTSASTPSMAGIVALLNHYLVANGNLAQPGLGNINPQLYRLAQSTPTAFHDITGGNNNVTCEQGSAGCLGATFGYAATPGYDLATGIGSVDANVLVTSWNTSTNAVNVTLSATPAQGTLNSNFQVVATVSAASGTGTPTGMVEFSNGTRPLGSVTLDASSGVPTASLSVPGWLLGSAATFTLTAQYRGDGAFSAGGATASVRVTTPTGVSAIVPSAPISVLAVPGPSGPVWQFNLSLSERGGVAAVLTGFTIDGQSQPVGQYFPAASIPANSTISSLMTFRNLAYPLVRTFGFTGVDAAGQSWSRAISVTFLAPQDVVTVLMTAVPLLMQQDPNNAACPWSQQIIINENSGNAETITSLTMGNAALSDRIIPIFGTTQLAAYRSLQGTLCWSSATPGTSDTVRVAFASGLSQVLTVTFAGPAINPAAVSASPASLTLATPDVPTQAALSVTAPDGQSWSASVFPQNRSTGWLKLSQASGTGSAQIMLQADGTGFETGVYMAEVVIQGPNLSPPSITVPVMFLYGDSSKMNITGLTNSASGLTAFAPGMTATIRGTALASVNLAVNGGAAFTYTTGGAPSGFGMTVNGIPAAFKLISPTRIDFQVPFETSAGPAVVGINNNGSVGGFFFQVVPAAPGIFADANGNLTPTATVQAGKALTLTMTGDGVVSPAGLGDGLTVSAASSLLFKPALPFTLTIGGVPVFLTSYGLANGTVGVTTLNVVVPLTVPAGPQPVVVTVAGVPSPPVNVTITAAP